MNNCFNKPKRSTEVTVGNSIHTEFQLVINHVAVLVSHLEHNRQIVLVATKLKIINVTQEKLAHLWPLLKSTIVILNLTYNYQR